MAAAAGFALSGCSASSPWQLYSIEGDSGYRSTRLRYVASERLGGIDVEIFNADGHLTAYLVSTGYQFRGDVYMAVNDQITQIPLAPHEGNMKMRLPDELTACMVQFLHNGQAVTITIGSQTETIAPFLQGTLNDEPT
jgi:hypothetical protein